MGAAGLIAVAQHQLELGKFEAAADYGTDGHYVCFEMPVRRQILQHSLTPVAAPYISTCIVSY